MVYKGYIWMMEFVEKLLEKIALKLHGKTEVTIGDKQVDFKPPFRRRPILEAIKEYAGVDVAGEAEGQGRRRGNVHRHGLRSCARVRYASDIRTRYGNRPSDNVHDKFPYNPGCPLLPTDEAEEFVITYFQITVRVSI